MTYEPILGKHMMLNQLAPDVRQKLLALTMLVHENTDIDLGSREINKMTDDIVRKYFTYLNRQYPDVTDRYMSIAAKKVFDND